MKKAFSTTKQDELVGKKEFAAIVLNLRYKTFIVNITSIDSSSNDQKGDVYLFCRI